MAETYSLALLGTAASATFIEKSVTLPDRLQHTAAKKNAAMTGALVQCINARGATGSYIYDAERSTPSLPVMRKLYG